MLNSRRYAVLTAVLSAVGVLPLNANADVSFPKSGEELIYTLHTHLNSPSLSLPSFDEFQIAAVCFINDTSACSGFGSGTSGDVPSFDLSSEDRCKNEGYTVTDCPDGYKAGGRKCPYGPYYSECVSVCPSDYVSCEEPYVGVGEACDGGLKCPFGEAWYCPSGGSQDMTELCSLMGYTQTCTGENQTGGTGQTCGGLYKDCTCDSTADWNGSSCVCKSEYKYSCTGSYQKPSGNSCAGKYASCTCSSPYSWSSGSCSCSSSYKYTCTSGSYVTGGSGTACNGLYASCSCSSPYTWYSSGRCECSSSYQYSCTSGDNIIGGSGTPCNGKYKECQCESGYTWCGGQCHHYDNPSTSCFE